LDRRAELLGQERLGSSACLPERSKERAEIEEIGDTQSRSSSAGEMKGVRNTQVGPFDGDAKHGSVGQLEEHPRDALTGAAVEERKSPASEGVKGMGQENAGICRTVCILLR
jgi:hypothetical protein